MTNDDFSLWLLREIEERGWSYSETARRGGISHARISQVIAGNNPGEEFCQAIARAFKIPVIEVMRRAGILEPLPAEPTRAQIAQLLECFDEMTIEERIEVLRYVRWVREREEGRWTTDGIAVEV